MTQYDKLKKKNSLVLEKTVKPTSYIHSAELLLKEQKISFPSEIKEKVESQSTYNHILFFIQTC